MNEYEFIEFINYDNINNKSLIKNNNNNNEFAILNIFKYEKKNNFTIKDMKYENIISIELDNLIQELEQSYKSLEQIKNQFILDISRSNLSINGNIVNNAKTALDYISYKYSNNTKREKELLIISTQALFAIPFFIIQKSMEKKELYLGELLDDDVKKYSCIKKYNVDICNNTIKLEKYLRLFSLNRETNDTTKYIVKILIDIQLSSERSMILTFQFIK